jgi:hypothetical protein
MAPYTIPEPRSGWMTTSPAGMSASRIARAVVPGSPSRRERAVRKPASTMHRSILPSSDGWNAKKGTFSDRWDPFATCPNASTARIERSRMP